jgi:outer membrane biosynthesis protein TonB
LNDVSAEFAKKSAELARDARQLRNLLNNVLTLAGATRSEDNIKQSAEAPAPANQNDEDRPQSDSSSTSVQTEAPVQSHADKQSTATSVIDIPPEQWKLGKPLASRGLELKPRKPMITVLTMLTAAPGNPLCVISFNRQGEVLKAAILQTSGDHRVDNAILASLYRWRASGKDLETAGDDHPLDVTVRILLTRQRVDQDA